MLIDPVGVERIGLNDFLWWGWRWAGKRQAPRAGFIDAAGSEIHEEPGDAGYAERAAERRERVPDHEPQRGGQDDAEVSDHGGGLHGCEGGGGAW